MRVAFGATVLARGLTHQQLDGIGYYTGELGRVLNSRSCQLLPIGFGQEMNVECFGQPLLYLPPYWRSAITSIAFQQSYDLRGVQADLFHATDHLIPRVSQMPVVATLMDAIPLSNPEWVNTKFRYLKNVLWRQAAKWADHVITISNHAAEQIQQHFQISAHRISVVPLGVDQRYFDKLPQDFLLGIKAKRKLNKPYFLCLGTLQPRKNIERVIEAFLNGGAAAPSKTHDLVIVGRYGWGCEPLLSRLQSLPSDGCIRWFGAVPDIEKRGMLQLAQGLVFPSLSEGFGLPVLEAFASGTPVITSNSSSLPEITGDAALLVNPMSITAIEQAMSALANDSALSDELRSKGYERARKYTWEACADQTMNIYKRLLS